MERLLEALREMGLTENECAAVRDVYAGDEKGLEEYVLLMRLHYDDRHEYVD